MFLKMDKRSVIFLLFLVLSTKSVYAEVQDDVNILLLMDHSFGANYKYIREIFEGYGWKITTTSVDEEIRPCVYETENITVDIVVQELGIISRDYDCISIMPGSVHNSLLNSDFLLNMLQDAHIDGMIITSWCRAIGILIEADIIQGRNVTGHDSYRDECEAKGATFFSQSPPIRDGNIITAVRSRYYRNETCELIKDTVEEVRGIDTSISKVSGGNLIIALSAVTIYFVIRLRKKILF